MSFFLFFLAFFFISGACGLIYEIIWMRHLALFFGSDIYSSSITLAAFMGGLALGGYLASRYVDKIRNHLTCYALLELSIGLYALFFTKFLYIFDPTITIVYAKYFENIPFIYHLTKITVAFICLIVPTAMMGATLPLMLRAFTNCSKKFGKTAGYFYAINTFGALTGVLISGFILIPYLGLHKTNIIAATGNFIIAFLSIFLIRFVNRKIEKDSAIVSEEKDTEVSEKVRKAALVATLASGFGSLAVEVVWTRILIQSFSATIYSFSMMLVSFLFGIAIGSRVIAKKIGTPEKAMFILVRLQSAIGISIAALACLSLFIPALYSVFVWGFSTLSSGLFGFGSVSGTLIISLIFIIPTTILLGAAFPAALKAYSTDVNSTGKHAGRILFINTLGCVAGALAAGFLLIPFLGSKKSLLLLSVVFFTSGLYMHYKITGNKLSKILQEFLRPLSALLLCIVIGIILPSQIILNYNMQKGRVFKVMHHSEDVSSIVDVLKTESGATILSIDGNIEADTSLTQRRHFVLKAELPLLLSAGPKEALVVGLGLGITTASLLKDDTVSRVDVIELLPAVIQAQEYLKTVNNDVLRDKRIHVRIDDGRNYLKFTDKNYDIITADPIHPRISGVGVLYTKKYYELIRDHLKESGVVLQWMPLYSLSPKSFEVAVRTMVEVFPNTSVWYVPGHIMFLGGKDKKPIFDYRLLQKSFQKKAIAEELASIGVNNAFELLRLQIMSPDALKTFLNRQAAHKTLNTEDLPYLEYHTPFEFLFTPKDNLKAILPYASNDSGVVSNMPPELLEKLAVMQREYRNDILQKDPK